MYCAIRKTFLVVSAGRCTLVVTEQGTLSISLFDSASLVLNPGLLLASSCTYIAKVHRLWAYVS